MAAEIWGIIPSLIPEVIAKSGDLISSPRSTLHLQNKFILPLQCIFPKADDGNNIHLTDFTCEKQE